MPDAKKLLIIHPGALGDFITTFPAIRRLKDAFLQTDVICRSELGKLALSLNMATRWLSIESARVSSLFSDKTDAEFASFLSTYQTILLFSFSTALEQSIAKASGRKVFRIPPRPEIDRREHVSAHVAHHLMKIGLLDSNLLSNNRLLPAAGGPVRLQKGATVLLHPGSGSTRKCWPIHHYLAVEALLAAMNFQTAFLLGPAETRLAEDLQAGKIPAERVHTLFDIDRLLALLKKTKGFIGNDSGVSHLAAYLGLPTVAIFGPSDPERWAPVGRAVRVVRPALPCMPCFETEAESCDSPACLENTHPSDVIQAFQTLIRFK